ncbi:hypothetical protein DFH06DRAFT_1182470 [Mycena polygramma]|nr:hypothetical protein DFH06DRAFT_1182470 [Mycena polygramma]
MSPRWLQLWYPRSSASISSWRFWIVWQFRCIWTIQSTWARVFRLFLARCSMVCKAWSAHAQRLLFRRVILSAKTTGDRFRPLPSFLAAIDPATEHGHWLAGCVVSLLLTHRGIPITSEPTWLAAALLRTRNLRHLSAPTLFLKFDMETLARLRESGPRITSLCIRQDYQDYSTKHRHITQQIVACFPSVRILEIAGFRPVLHPFDPPLKLALVAFKFSSWARESAGPYLASLLDPHPEEGTALQDLWHWSDGAVTDILKAHGTHLRSLSVKALQPTPTSLAVACPHLERFEIQCFPDASMLALIHRSITTLVIRNMPPGPADVDALVQALETFPCLKTLMWQSYSPALNEVCEMRGIQVRVLVRNKAPRDDNEVQLELRQKYIRI